MTKYLSLTIPDTTVFRGKISGDRLFKLTDVEFYLNNISIADVLERLELLSHRKESFSSKYPIVDETHYRGHIGSVLIDGETLDLDEMDKKLSAYGIRLRLVEGLLDMVVIRCGE